MPTEKPKHIINVLNAEPQSKSEQRKETAAERPSCQASTISRSEQRHGTLNTVRFLFKLFESHYASAWTQHVSSDETESTQEAAWLDVLAQMTEREIRAAVRYLKSRDNTRYADFPPNPLQFLKIPRDLALQTIPTMDECYNAAIKRDWSFHPIVKPAAEACDIYWLTHQASAYDGRKRFSGHYAAEKEKYVRDGAVSQPKRRIENKRTSKIPTGTPQLEIERRVAWFKKRPEYADYCKADGLDAKQAIWNKTLAIYHENAKNS